MKDFLAIRALSSGTYRTEKLGGVEYLVVPVVALVEGVLQGVTAEQPELALAEEFGRFPTAWNGRPLTIDHPYIVDSANNEIIRVSASQSPEILQDFQIGFIFNTQLDGSKLRMEAWIDPEKAENHSEAARVLLGKIRKGEAIEVSTGLFTGSEKEQGTYGDRQYFGVWRGVVPDHLALLPDGLIGACSNADGCGVYANAQPLSVKGAPELRIHVLKQACSCDSNSTGASVPSTHAFPPKTPSANAAALSFDPQGFLANQIPDGMMDGDIRSIIQKALDVKYSGAYCYLIGFTNSKAIFSMYDSINSDRDTYQCSYNVDAKAKTCTFEDDRSRVILTTSITVASDPGSSRIVSPRDLSASTTTPTQETQMSITASEARAFLVNFGHTTDALKAMKDEDVLKLHKNVQEQLAAYADKAKKDEEDEEDGKKVPPKTNSAGSTSVPPTTPTVSAPVTVEQYLAAAPAGLRESLEAGMRMHTQHKQKLIDQIKTNKLNKFSDQQLSAMDVPMLESIAAFAEQPVHDYSGMAQPGGLQTQQQPTVNQGDLGYAAEPPRLGIKAA